MLVWVFLFIFFPSNRINAAGLRFPETFSTINETWEILDIDKNDGIDPEEFTELWKYLFQNASGTPYNSYNPEQDMLDTTFRIFDLDENEFLSYDEFRFCYDNWIRTIIKPVSILAIIDVQNDFITGTLAMKNAPAGQEGKDVVAPINKLLETVSFRQVFYTKDWHPPNHISFIDNVNLRKLHASSKVKRPEDVKLFDTVVFEGKDGQLIEQTLWPRHAVANTWGAELDPDLIVQRGCVIVTKGTQSEMDSYSAFMDNTKKTIMPLKGLVDEVGTTDLYVSGLAYDYCAGESALDSLNLGYRTIMIDDAIRGVASEGIENMKEKIMKSGGVIVQSDDVNDMVQGKDRRPELGFYLAKRLQLKMESSTMKEPI